MKIARMMICLFKMHCPPFLQSQNKIRLFILLLPLLELFGVFKLRTNMILVFRLADVSNINEIFTI